MSWAKSGTNLASLVVFLGISCLGVYLELALKISPITCLLVLPAYKTEKKPSGKCKLCSHFRSKLPHSHGESWDCSSLALAPLLLSSKSNNCWIEFCVFIFYWPRKLYKRLHIWHFFTKAEKAHFSRDCLPRLKVQLRLMLMFLQICK